MTETAVLTLVDGVRVVVPDSLNLITPYVLREQQDFFEDELGFVRTLLQAGQKVIDIGANYGVYTLPMAQKVGPSGHVWSFEPTSSTAHFLARGIKENAFGHVTLEQKAVSSAPGNAQISLQRHSELNAIIHGEPPAGESETVTLATLDECMVRFRWADIELIKIDAEGEEENIVKGGRSFFAELTPLVQYELRKTAADMNFALIHEFAAIGYSSYRLVPGLDVLVPFDAGAPPDPYLLNLFCCKADRADRLAARGLLLRASDISGLERSVGANTKNRSDTEGNYHWRHALAHRPYATSLSTAWSAAKQLGDHSALTQSLALYACSRDAALPPAERFRALEASYSGLNAVCERDPARLRLASLARVAHDYGERAASVNALKRLLAYIHHAGVDPSEPFLAPLERFESIPCGEKAVGWLVAAVLEQLERREYFSSFYAGPAARERLEDIHALGLGSAEMQRRLDLVRRRFGPAHPPPSA
jgi:FkbM family methyltransferase